MSAPARARIGLRDTLRVLAPYARRNLLEQLSSIAFIIVYLILFQLLVLQLPIVGALMIATGLAVVAVGLALFMEGLRLGLMPLGESIGTVLPRRSTLPLILAFAFLLGMGATFAEPAIAVLRAAGRNVSPVDAPLLHALLNPFAGQLVTAVGLGVGLAVLLGVLRFFHGWPLKGLAIPAVAMLGILSLIYSWDPLLADVLGLAWDCGAVTTGPVTVPLVLALGIGVSRIVHSGDGANAGFGIVTLASLFPILAVLLLAGYHYLVADYEAARPDPARTAAAEGAASPAPPAASDRVPIDQRTFDRFLADGTLPRHHRIRYAQGEAALEDGRIVLREPVVVIEQIPAPGLRLLDEEQWRADVRVGEQLLRAILDALRAIVPLCAFLLLVLLVLLRERLADADVVAIGLAFALAGMTLFGLGIALGLTPLGSQLGANVPATFSAIVPWGQEQVTGPMFGVGHAGKIVAVAFAFFLGYGATLAEPALNALGDTVERITIGAFPKRLLMQSVAIGVGVGIAAGVVKIAYDLPLVWMLLPPYALVLLLTWRAPHDFVNFAWDSAGVTTGPITVPLVLAMGLGIGGSVPGVSDGFGILALASVGPILTVLCVGLYTRGDAELGEGLGGRGRAAGYRP